MERLERLLSEAHTRTAEGFTLWDDFAIEVETAFLLHGLVRQLKPKLIVESGTGRGVSTVFLAEALVLNEDHGAPAGRLVTFEPHEFFRDGAQRWLTGSGLPITFEEGVSKDTDLRPEFVFIDCVSDLRQAEISWWLTHPDRPLTVVHDAHRSEYPFHLGDGVHIPGNDGVWIGRAKPQETA